MKIIALWTVCLVRLCSAGFWCCCGKSKTNDRVAVQADDNDPPQVTSTPPQHSIAPAGQFSSEAPPVRQSSGNVDPTPFTLDLANPDGSKVCVSNREDNGVTVRGYTPNKDVKVTSLMDAGATVWNATGKEECLFAELSTKGDSSLAMIWVYAGNNGEYKYFEKVGGEWTSIGKKDYDKKLNEMIKSGISSANTTPQQHEVTEDNDQQSNGHAAEQVTDASLESGDIPLESSMTHSEEQSGSDDSASQDAESSGNATVDRNEQATGEDAAQSTPTQSPDDPKPEPPASTSTEGSQHDTVYSGSDSNASGTINYSGDAGGAKGTLKGAEKRNPPESTHSASSLPSKVDTSLFNVVDSVEDNVKVLKLTPKGDKVTKVNYDDKEVWSGGGLFSKSNLVEALIYFDGDIPVLTTIKAVKGGKESTVYRYYDGKQWKNGNESNHKKKLKELQDAARPKESTETVGDNVEEKARPANKPGDVPARRDPVKTVQQTPQAPSTNKPDTEDSPVVQQNLYTPTQSPPSGQTANSDQKTTESANKGQGSPVPQPSGQSGLVLDLAKPDETNIDVHIKNESEVTVKYHYPKDTSKDTTVMDGNKELWTPINPSDTCLSCLIYKKGSMELLKIVVVEKNSIAYKYFEKNADGTWKNLTQDDFSKKLYEMRKS